MILTIPVMKQRMTPSVGQAPAVPDNHCGYLQKKWWQGGGDFASLLQNPKKDLSHAYRYLRAMQACKNVHSVLPHNNMKDFIACRF